MILKVESISAPVFSGNRSKNKDERKKKQEFKDYLSKYASTVSGMSTHKERQAHVEFIYDTTGSMSDYVVGAYNRRGELVQ